MNEFSETEIGKIPLEWEVKEIGSLLEEKGISVGVMYPGEFTNDGVPLIRAGDIKNGKIVKTIQYRISKSTNEMHKRTILNGDELLVVLVGQPGIGVVVDEYFKGWNVARAIGVLRLSDKSERQYVVNALKHTGVRNLLLASCNTTVQPTLNLAELKEVLIPWPPKEQRLSISTILSCLDDKIDLLHRQNATLEKMAETLFRQWFVEEVNDEWEEIRLGSIVEVINGVSYKSDDLSSSSTAMVTLKSFDRNGGFRMDGFKEYTGKYKEQHILREGDLVVAHTDITQEADVIGNPVMVIGNPKYDTLVFSMDLVKVVSKNENYSSEFLYLLMKNREFKEHCLGYSNGSTVLHLNKKAVPEYKMKLPPNNLINEFSKKVKQLVQKQFRNQTQIRTLTTLRDNLLPKLMSGEVRVEM